MRLNVEQRIRRLLQIVQVRKICYKTVEVQVEKRGQKDLGEIRFVI